MKKYVENVMYILQHKWYVFIECWKEGLYWQGIVHDMSKFSLAEFPAYANNFFSSLAEQAETKGEIKKAFSYAWLHHQHHNRHHWNYWVVTQHKKEALPMPEKYILEMVCDWRAMSHKFGDTAQEFFEHHHHRMVLNPETLTRIEQILDVHVVSNKRTS
ncbi:MAG: hypothetical protein GY797_35505 [Deltaproteobacteria bacterium]|nr:hypothetical protein [Deltaproteobacteria bacterium]